MVVSQVTNVEFSSRVLEIAYSAVKSQRTHGDILKLWMPNDKLRIQMIESEKTLQNALIRAKLQDELASRGGQKQKQTI